LHLTHTDPGWAIRARSWVYTRLDVGYHLAPLLYAVVGILVAVSYAFV